MREHLMNTVSALPIMITHGHESMLYDSDGNWYYDLWNDVGVASLGYTVPRTAMSDFLQQDIPHRLPAVYNSALGNNTAERLCKVMGMSKVFFCNSGTEATEAAVKLVRKYWHDHAERHGNAGMGLRGRDIILTLTNQFHGRTGFGMGASDSANCMYHKVGMGPWPDGFSVVSPETLMGQREGDDVVMAREWDNYNQEYTDPRMVDWRDVAAIMMGPVLGNNVVKPYPPELFAKLSALRDEYGFKIIFDEVQTGMGRIGYYAGYKHPKIGIHPDVLCLGKGLALGLPSGACLASGDIADTFKPGMHFSTFGGTSLNMFMIWRFLDWMHENLTVVRANETIFDDFFGCRMWVKRHSGYGMLWEFELNIPGVDNLQFCEAARKNNLLIVSFRPTGPIKIAPPLNMSHTDLLRTFALMDKTAASLAQE